MQKAEQIRIAVQITRAALVAYWISFWFTSLFPGYLPKIGGLWSSISAIMGTQLTRRETTASASLRILGTGIGSTTSAVYLSFLPFHPLGMGIAILVTALLCMAVNIPGHARLAAITVITVIMVMVTASLGSNLNPLLNALLRFAESCIGTLVAILIVLIWPEKPTASGPDT